VRILQLIPIRRKPKADEWLGEESVKAIYQNRFIDRVLLIKLLATLLFIKKLNETQLTSHAARLIQCESHRLMEQFNGFMGSHLTA
jgi:hypothetical protein